MIIRKPVNRVPPSNPSRRAATVLHPACSLLALAATGVVACVAGTALLEGTLPLESLACSRVA